MRTRNTRRVAALAAAVLGAGLALASCADDNSGGRCRERHLARSRQDRVRGPGAAGRLRRPDRQEVGVYTSIVAPEDQAQKDSYKLFTTCTGAKVNYEGSKEFEAQLPVRVQAGNPPDIAYVPQPGLLKTLVATGKVVEAPSQVVATTSTSSSARTGRPTARVDDKFYAAPLGANVKSFVWYSPKMFADNGWEVPDDLGRHARPLRHHRRHRASSRGAPASSPVRRPAGRPPTGSRTSCSAPPAPTSTTSGSTTTSRSTTRRSPRRSTTSAAS